MNLVAIGLGYCARHFVETRGLRAATIGTSRDRGRVDALRAEGLRALWCDGPDHDPELAAALGEAEALLVSAAPGEHGDPVLAAFGERLAGARRLERVVYLSTVGVYGDRSGAWTEEDAPLRPANRRTRARVEAEAAWREFGARSGARTQILRLAGIYGPGRNALAAVAAGRARRIRLAGQVFNRIHVEDVARAVEAALASLRSGVWNVADDEPGDPAAPVEFAAELLGVPPPPEIDYEKAEMTPMARSFWGESKRVSNRRLKTELGVALAFPSYRDGLRSLFEAGEGLGGTR